MNKYSISALGLLLLSCPSFAKWHFTPDISVQELYTNNIDLSPNYRKSAEWVTEVAPRILLDNHSDKNPLVAYYRAQALHYGNNHRQDKVYHQGFAKLGKNFYSDRMHLSLTADHAQTVLFPSNRITLDNIRGGRSTNISRMLVGPSFNHNLGSAFKTDYRYQFGYVNYHQDVPNALTHDADWSLTSAPTKRWYFNTHAHWDTTRQKSRNLAERLEAIASVGYYVTKRLRPYVGGGYEDHTNQRGFNELDGARWHAGVFYQPSKRLFIDGNYGRRSFGDSYYFNASWFRKHTSLSASYQEEVTNFFRTQIMMLPTIEVNNLGLVTIQFQPQVREDVFVRKVASVSWQSQTHKTWTRIQPYIEKREVEATATEERGKGINGEFGYIRNPKLQFMILGGFAHQKLINDIKDERYQVGMRVNHQIARKTQLTLGYSHFQLERTHEPSIHENTVSFRMIFQA